MNAAAGAARQPAVPAFVYPPVWMRRGYAYAVDPIEPFGTSTHIWKQRRRDPERVQQLVDELHFMARRLQFTEQAAPGVDTVEARHPDVERRASLCESSMPFQLMHIRKPRGASEPEFSIANWNYMRPAHVDRSHDGDEYGDGDISDGGDADLAPVWAGVPAGSLRPAFAASASRGPGRTTGLLPGGGFILEVTDRRVRTTLRETAEQLSSEEIAEVTAVNHANALLLVRSVASFMASPWSPRTGPVYAVVALPTVDSEREFSEEAMRAGAQAHSKATLAALTAVARACAHGLALRGVLLNVVDSGWQTSSIHEKLGTPLPPEHCAARVLHPLVVQTGEHGRTWTHFVAH